MSEIGRTESLLISLDLRKLLPVEKANIWQEILEFATKHLRASKFTMEPVLSGSDVSDSVMRAHDLLLSTQGRVRRILFSWRRISASLDESTTSLLGEIGPYVLSISFLEANGNLVAGISEWGETADVVLGGEELGALRKKFRSRVGKEIPHQIEQLA